MTGRVRVRRRSESGATVVLVAVMAVLIFSVGAMAVDLGNAFARKRDSQSQADFSALAGASKLPATATSCPGSRPSASSPAVLEVVKYLTLNAPNSDGETPPSAAQLAADLVDCNDENGEVSFPTNYRIRVVTPPSVVDFGLASVIASEFQNTKVRAAATVQIKSPGTAVMPVYAVAGCDYGPQTITDPAAGQASNPVVPELADNDAETNGVVLTSITATPSPVQVGSTTTQLQVDGTGLGPSTKVGFFRTAGSPAPTLVTVAVPPAVVSAQGSQRWINLTVPTSVTSVEAVWYVRVMDASGKWSARADAQPLRVGNAVLECLGAANDGNFGTLKIPRKDVADNTVNGWLPTNMARGLQPPLSLAVYPNPATAPATCGPSPAVVSDKDHLREGTNCLDTDTGLPANAATAGMITGVTGTAASPGRLDRATTPGCGANSADRNARWDTGIGKGSSTYTINDDLLTCFLTNSSTTLDTIVQPSYSGPAVLSAKIFASPRFMWVPVLKVQPVNGSSQKYSIVGFRPGFLTDQPLTATKANMALGTTTAHNGLTIQNNSIQTMKVMFFNVAALPETADASMPTTPYLGSGTKIITLVD